MLIYCSYSTDTVIVIPKPCATHITVVQAVAQKLFFQKGLFFFRVVVQKQGATLVQWLALSPNTKKVLGSIPSAG